MLSHYIDERVFALDDSIKIEINTNEVIIEKGAESIVVTRNVYEGNRIDCYNVQTDSVLLGA